MTNKKTEKMCKEVDEEGYYRWIKERDAKRFSWLKVFKKEGVKKALYYLLHMTGVHTLPHSSKNITIDNHDEEIWACKTCGYECTSKGILWEVLKYCLTWVGLVGFSFSSAFYYMFPLLVTSIGLWLIFFIIVHALAGLRSFFQIFVS